MKTRVLGQTRAEVSALCLGTMYFGTAIDRRAAYGLLDQYSSAGNIPTSHFDAKSKKSRRAK